MSQQTEHTRTPWKWGYTNWRGEPLAAHFKPHISGAELLDWEGNKVSTGICIVEGNATSRVVTEANADFIVNACNSHDALVKACREQLALVIAMDKLLTFYRIGKRPSESVLCAMEKKTEVIEMAAAALALAKGNQ